MLPSSLDGKTFVGPGYNAGFKHSGKVRKSLYEALKELINNLDNLAEEFGLKKGEIEIGVFEGLRDLSSQKILFDN